MHLRPAAVQARDLAVEGDAMPPSPAVIRTAIAPTALEHRARRLDMVVRELRKRARHHPAPHLIAQAVEGLESELMAVRHRLRRG
jgi:hypothetical protein